jgi:hypothetical protein
MVRIRPSNVGRMGCRVPEAEAELIHAIYERIVVAGSSFWPRT